MEFNFAEMIDSFVDDYTKEVVGGLLVFIIVLLFKYAKAFVNNALISKKYSGYIGCYFLYEYSSTGLDKITKSSLEIKLRFGKLVVTRDHDSDVYAYSGVVYITERNIYIYLDGKNHEEKVTLIFYNPLHRSIRKLTGVSCSISPIDEPVAKYCILTDLAVEKQFVVEDIKKLREQQEENLLKVPRDNGLFFDNLKKGYLEKHDLSEKKEEEENK